jgi:hypothetical protein
MAQRLRDLPRELTPPFEFEELRRRARSRSDALIAARRGVSLYRRAAVAAAVCCGLLAAAVLLSDLSSGGLTDGRIARTEPGPLPDLTEAAFDPERMRASERWLASLPENRALVRVGTRLAATDLEDRIAAVDDLLNAERVGDARAAQLKALQRERARLVDSLVQVRYAESLAAELP